MITTIIIDDNKIIREYFQTMIDWESKGFALVAIANNGITGWQEFCKHRPQLVISDVRMPGITGLELARKIKDESPDTMIVFISNYEDFSYVKGAMDIGVFDYILKHETRGSKLDEKLAKIKVEFERLQQSRRNYYESKLILALSSHDIKNIAQTFPDRYNLIIFEQISFLPPFSTLTNSEMKEIEENEFHYYLTQYRDLVICDIRIDKYRYAVLTKPSGKINRFSEEVCKQIYQQTKTRFYALPVCENQLIEDCISSYKALNSLIKTKYFSKHEYVISPDIKSSVQVKNTALDQNELTNVLKQADIEKMCELLDHCSHTIIKNLDYEQLCQIVSILLNFIINNSKNLSSHEFILYAENDAKFWTNANEIFFWLKNKLMQLFNCLNRNPIYTYSQPVKITIDYINDNYANSDLTAGEIADHVGIDANRLNKMIKDETGLTVIKWLTNTRIEKAKQLLMQHKKLTQIYSDVGYTNISYFANVFKKVCGETPLEYRRKAIEKNSKN